MGMVDVRPKGLLRRRDEHLEEEEEEEDDDARKCCVLCKATKTPLWRGGPAGPKSLCNACGIRFRKRRISTKGSNRGCDRKRESFLNNGSSTVSATSSCSRTMGTTTTGGGGGSGGGDGEEDLGECGSLRMRLMMALGNEMMQNLPLAVKKQCQRPSKLGEEEQAAVSLMALSCGYVLS